MHKIKQHIAENFHIIPGFSSTWMEYDELDLGKNNKISVVDSLAFFEKMNVRIVSFDKPDKEWGKPGETDLLFSVGSEEKYFQFQVRDWSRLIYGTVSYSMKGHPPIKSRRFFDFLKKEGVVDFTDFLKDDSYQKKFNLEALFRSFLYRKALSCFDALIVENISFLNIAKTKTQEKKAAYLIDFKIKRTQYQLMIFKLNELDYRFATKNGNEFEATENHKKMLKQLKKEAEKLNFQLPYGYDRQVFRTLLENQILKRIWNSKEYKLRALYEQF